MEAANLSHPEILVTEQEYLASWQVFAKDLYIVREGKRLHSHSPFDKPPKPEHHNYYLTQQSNKDLSKLDKTKITVVVCMDWRVAYSAWQKAKDLGYQDDEIMMISIAGGMVQGNVERQNALKNILSYVFQNAPHLEKAYLSGHNKRCGAVALWLGETQGEIPQQIRKDETRFMCEFIADGVYETLPKNTRGVEILSGLLIPEEDEHHLVRVTSTSVDLSRRFSFQSLIRK